MRSSVGLIVLLVFYLALGQIGLSLGQLLTVFSVLVWAVAAGLFTYMVFFKGMRFTLFDRGKPEVGDIVDAEVTQALTIIDENGEHDVTVIRSVTE